MTAGQALDPDLPRGIPDGDGTIVTVGTFDGVHRGHWAVLQEIRERAALRGLRAVLVTFHPHPLRVVRPDSAPPLLTTPIEKKEILAESGLDYAVFLRFTVALSRYTPERFVDDVLIGRLGVRELVIGFDHGFGRGRSGDAGTLRRIGADRGFDVDVVPPVHAGEGAISSTRIRRAIARGDLADAAAGLGRHYGMRAVVIRGDGRGRSIGFPTANLGGLPPDKALPPAGVYAVRGSVRTGTFDGALHLGPRPTFPGAVPSVELHLLDFDGNLYGEEVRVDFVDRLRDVRPFESVEALVQQLHRDVARAREILRRE
ncbi:MAG: bifunctional riboflavin kinase/FAD synthetase [Gemmatimonadetes bacterium]|nr:bifunctional riboflavin kinase/FAD synthetase [Gemmatimonadota bacterium]NNF38623.1 bifunctional riboflavin kinase/FAD synthetase [Gemmatimonadota bacterium]